ncbi:MAG TPA: phosphate ABC transporter permease PstA [Acidimicrobiales bacterium]|nr:phosphate ABC transporter permease PstA [Acidimicrobiales bacterium]
MGAHAASVASPGGPPARAPFVIARSRRVRNRLWWALCALGLVILVVPVVWILYGVFDRGVIGWRWSVLWTPTQGVAGGLSNDIVGTLLITFGVGVMATIVGVGCGVYLSEFMRPGMRRSVLRGAYEVLSGIPSIVFGYVGYVALDVGLHWQFSLLAALIVLSLLVVPYIAKATETSLNQVPTAYREGGEALGMAKSYQLRKIVVRAALPGMLTGLVVAIAISVGETAPLLYTAGASEYYPTGALVHSPVPYLTQVVYADFDSSFPQQHVLANDAAMLLVLLVVAILLGSRLIVRATQKYAPNRAFAANKTDVRRSFRRRSSQSTEALFEGSGPHEPAAEKLDQ